MGSSDKKYRLDREALRDLAGPGVDPWTDEDVLLEMIKGKEVLLPLKDENFDNFDARAVILSSVDEEPGAAELLIEDWQGHVRQRRWAIKLL